MWRGTKCSAVLEGHSGPVLSLAVLTNGTLVSGSGDKTIRMWSGNTCVATLTGHTDTVR